MSGDRPDAGEVPGTGPYWFWSAASRTVTGADLAVGAFFSILRSARSVSRGNRTRNTRGDAANTPTPTTIAPPAAEIRMPHWNARYGQCVAVAPFRGSVLVMACRMV